ncbi:DinB family protein [Telmatocola sphagniphila]|uniref:DinB family protein n=1 Tax=Telmatocola sphagniphila TaxID=1123043 RepID=A0A8E6B4D6_9BACT|nr:DinB family protein [Telmatocola sphagniphila]QVL31089.1 DinB family protein [Telmatocola sphagniphila]
MTSMPDRFRKWYDYERDCNAKTLVMLNSVPEDKRPTPQFHRAVGRMAHLVAARQRWLHRLGHWAVPPEVFPSTSLEDLPQLINATEEAWVNYLQKLDDRELEREFEWKFPTGAQMRWNVEGVLTQTFGHAWYHRGQIAQTVAELGGQATDTDYIFWSKPTRVDAPNA